MNGTQNITNSKSANARLIINKFVVDLIVGFAATTEIFKSGELVMRRIQYVRAKSIHELRRLKTCRNLN